MFLKQSMARRWAACIVVLAVTGGWGVARADAEGERLQAQVVGTWREVSPGDNLLVFSSGGTFQLLLRKGAMGAHRTVDGQWRVADKSLIHIAVILNGKPTNSRQLALVFRDDEMVFVDDKGRETRHRRHVGALPSDYVW